MLLAGFCTRFIVDSTPAPKGRAGQHRDRIAAPNPLIFKPMFSGIVAAVGRITQLSARADENNTVRLTVDAGALGLDDVALGDSIACNGVCLTVVEIQDNCFRVDVSPETLSCTVGLAEPGEINMEKALRLSDRLGGHLVSGHVDGVGEVLRFDAIGDNRQTKPNR